MYGSRDAGNTVFASNTEMNNLMKKAAGRMNLKEHKVGKDNIFDCVIFFLVCSFHLLYLIVNIGFVAFVW